MCIVIVCANTNYYNYWNTNEIIDLHFKLTFSRLDIYKCSFCSTIFFSTSQKIINKFFLYSSFSTVFIGVIVTI